MRSFGIPPLALFLFSVSTAGAVHAQEPAAIPISLDEALQLLDASNLELHLARNGVAVMEARARTARGFANPGLFVEQTQLTRDEASYRETIVALEQTLEIGGQRGLRRRVAETAVRASSRILEAELTRLAFDVHREYIRAAVADADLVVLREATEVFRQVEEMGEARFVDGDLSRFDRDRLLLERARYETLLARGELALNDAFREFTLLISPDLAGTATVLVPSASLAEMLEEVTEAAGGSSIGVALLSVSERADVGRAAAEVEAAQAALSLSRRERVPDLTLSGGYREQADGLRGAVLGLSLPLPFWNRNQGRIDEAGANLDAALARHDLVRRRAEMEIQRAWEVHRTLQEQSRVVSETLLTGSAGLLETAGVAYAEGEMSLIQLLDAADAYSLTRRSMNELLGDYLISLFDLQRATGVLLESMPSTITASPR